VHASTVVAKGATNAAAMTKDSTTFFAVNLKALFILVPFLAIWFFSLRINQKSVDNPPLFKGSQK
jgi:hypothetical protein